MPFRVVRTIVIDYPDELSYYREKTYWTMPEGYGSFGTKDWLHKVEVVGNWDEGDEEWQL